MIVSLQYKRYFNFFCIFLNCATAGSVFTFPLYSTVFGAALNLSAFHLQVLISSAVGGQYSSAVLFGALGDSHGPGIVSLVAAILYGIGYLMLAWRSSIGRAEEGKWIFLSLYYSIVGAGVAASYFAALIASTKSLPTRLSGLAIGVPLSIFGLSPLILSFLASFFTTTTSTGTIEINPQKYLLFLGIFLPVVNLISAFGLKVLPWEEEEEEEVESTSSSPAVLIDSGFGASRINTPLLDEHTPLLLPSTISKLNTNSTLSSQTFKEYVQQIPFWILGIILILSIGPCEMMMSSLGSIVESLLGIHIAEGRESEALLLRQTHVRVLSISNTVSRLAIGALSDYLSYSTTSSLPSTLITSTSSIQTKPKGVSRLFFILTSCTFLSIAFAYVALIMKQASGLYILTITTGFAYGTIFTMAPSITRSIWPVEDFGRNYGLLSWFSAIGAIIYTPLYGILSDRVASTQQSPICYGRECYESIFVISSASCLVAIGLLGVLWFRYWKFKV